MPFLLSSLGSRSTLAQNPLLRVTGLSVGYGRRSVLNGLSLTLHAGECLVILGPNGSGKTTLLRAVSGVVPAQAGSVELLGRPIASMSVRERARCLAVAPQRARYPQRVTARQYVLLGRFARLSWLGVYGRTDHVAVDRALEESGATTLAKRPLAELSGGELQRVLLARVLAQECPLLLLDELASGLDMARTVDAFTVLERRRAAGAGLIVVMHDCNLAALYATRLLGLRAGRILFDGPVADVFTEEHLHALYSLSVVVLPHPHLGLPQALPCRTPSPLGVSSWPSGPDDSDSIGLRR
ncbi:MAG: ABC transporter ATP-binding protein [Desulfovibrio sp.]|nr:ABC transporter ATP-binding protein [Desulfovibrio sp.]